MTDLSGLAPSQDSEPVRLRAGRGTESSRRALLGSLVLAPLWSWSRRAEADPGVDPPKVIEFSPGNKHLLYDEVASKVVPPTGFESRIALRDSIVRLVQHGVIDLGKFFDLQRFALAADGNTGSTTAAKPESNRRGGIVPGSGAWPDLKLAGADRQVRSIAYSPGAYSVTTADGRSALFLENDLRFKIDSSGLGPDWGKPVIAPAGTEGDRAWVFFSSPKEISAFIGRQGS